MTRRPPRIPAAPFWADSKSCPDKIPFFSRQVAKQRAAELRKTGSDLHVYWCSNCFYWHLGHEAGKSTGVRHADRLYQTPQQRQPTAEGEN